MNKDFHPKPMYCKVCGDKIMSSYEGEFVTCKCGAISVDQTAYYSRYIGEPSNFSEEPTDVSEC